MEGSSPRLNSHIVTATVPTAEMAAMIAEMSATILLSFPSDVFLNYPPSLNTGAFCHRDLYFG